MKWLTALNKGEGSQLLSNSELVKGILESVMCGSETAKWPTFF